VTEHKKARTFTRNGFDWTNRYPASLRRYGYLRHAAVKSISSP
jgi:hypothetical protein